MVEPNPFRSATRSATAIVLVVAGAILLSGCVSSGEKPSPGPSATSASDAAGGDTAQTTSTPTSTPTEPPTPVTMNCNAVVTADQMHSFNPNFGTDPSYAPQKGSLEKQIADWKGTVCGWLDPSNKETIAIAVGKPPANELEGLKNTAVTESKPVPTYGIPPTVEGYFNPGTAGEVQIFTGEYWIVATSTAFFEPGDPAPLMQNVLDNLPSN